MVDYQIEEIAKLSGLTKRTIRYYEEIGLLEPPKRTEGGYRLYSEKHIDHLKKVINAREVLRISLKEVQKFIEIRDEVNNNILGYK